MSQLESMVLFLMGDTDVLSRLDSDEQRLYFSVLNECGLKRSRSTDYVVHVILTRTVFNRGNLIAGLCILDNQIHDLINPELEEDQNKSAHNYLSKLVDNSWIVPGADALKQMLASRRNFGLQKYKSYLTKDSLRDSLTDYSQEIGDACVYALISIKFASSMREILSVISLWIRLGSVIFLCLKDRVLNGENWK